MKVGERVEATQTDWARDKLKKKHGSEVMHAKFKREAYGISFSLLNV